MNEHQVKQLELTIDQAKNNINRMHKLQKLLDNKEFQAIITEGYFRDEAARLVQLRADANLQGEAELRHVDRLIDGVGALRQYFSMIEQFGRTSERALKDHEQTREELLQEEMNEEGAVA